MEFAELKNKNLTELKELLAEQRSALFECRLKARNKHLKQFHKIPEFKKTIARIMTALTALGRKSAT